MSQSIPPPLTPPPVARNALIGVVVTALVGAATALGYYVAPDCPPCAPAVVAPATP